MSNLPRKIRSRRERFRLAADGVYFGPEYCRGDILLGPISLVGLLVKIMFCTGSATRTARMQTEQDTFIREDCSVLLFAKIRAIRTRKPNRPMTNLMSRRTHVCPTVGVREVPPALLVPKGIHILLPKRGRYLAVIAAVPLRQRLAQEVLRVVGTRAVEGYLVKCITRVSTQGYKRYTWRMSIQRAYKVFGGKWVSKSVCDALAPDCQGYQNSTQILNKKVPIDHTGSGSYPNIVLL